MENDGEWQDWRCHQAIEKIPGSSPLCNACKHVFGVRVQDSNLPRPNSEFLLTNHESPELLFTYMGRISPQGTVTRSEIQYLRLLYGLRNLKDDLSIHEVLPNTYPTSNLDLIANWVARCTSQHSTCNTKSSTRFFRPTRHLDNYT
ncbi:hypothetical protein BDR22DRAFT_689965 [Usnea florida]